MKFMSLTPEQFDLLVTKVEYKRLEEKVNSIDNKLDKVAIEVLATKEDLKQFATKDDMDQKFNTVLTAIDGLAKNVVKFQEDITSNQGAHDRIEEKVNNHGVRIGKLEASAA
jgi:SMC interacting uncharacterized protein involved in chromosome segregation